MKGKRRAAQAVLDMLGDRGALTDLEWMAQIGARHVIDLQDRQRQYKAKNPSHHRNQIMAWKGDHPDRFRLNGEIAVLRASIQRLEGKPANAKGVDWPARREQYMVELVSRYIERWERYGAR